MRYGLSNKEQKERDKKIQLQNKVEELTEFMSEKIDLVNGVVTAFKEKAYVAAKAGKNETADTYIMFAADMAMLANELEFANDFLTQQTAITLAFLEVGTLNSAYQQLKKMLGSAPDISKLLRSREELTKATDEMRYQFRKLHRDMVRPNRSKAYTRSIDLHGNDEYKTLLGDMKREIESRVATDETPIIATSNTAKDTAKDMAKEIDSIMKMIDAETGKQ